ncbi:MAG TPA: superinfection immunity protein, partial [Alphaproteobacteria bacterium]
MDDCAARQENSALQSAQQQEQAMVANTIGAIIALVMIIAIYLLPVIIASTRSLNNTAAIAVVNIFLGWTFFGWIAALVWALAE